MAIDPAYLAPGNAVGQMVEGLQRNQFMNAQMASQAGQDQRAQGAYDLQHQAATEQLARQQQYNALLAQYLGPDQAALAQQGGSSQGAAPQNKNALLQQMYAADPERTTQLAQFQASQQAAVKQKQQEHAKQVVSAAQFVLQSERPKWLLKNVYPEFLTELEKQGVDVESMDDNQVHSLAMQLQAHYGPITGAVPVQLAAGASLVNPETGITVATAPTKAPNRNVEWKDVGDKLVPVYSDTGEDVPGLKPKAKAASPSSMNGAAGFDDPKIQALQASIAASGFSLPAGFRSQAAQLSLLRGVLAKYPALDPDDIAHLLGSGAIDYKGLSKATQTASGIAGKVEFANKELEAFAPIALDASAAVDRGSFVPFNKLMQMGQKNISDPNMKRLYVATQSILNSYNMLSARGGTDAEVREHNRQVLQAADSPEAYQAAIEMIMREGKAAGEAAAKAMDPDSYRHNPKATDSGSAPVRIATPAEAAKLSKGTRFITPDGQVRVRH